MRTVQLQQGSQEWLQWRASKFGASDAPAMLGCSSYKTRTQLLDEKKTGITPEVDAATQRRFDEGHRIEALARPLAEEIVGEDLYPVSGESGQVMAASFDGLTLMENIAWECKTVNARLREALKHGSPSGEDLPEEYRVQMAHQQIVAGCDRTLFTAAKFGADGQPEEVWHVWYTAEPSLQKRVLDGWQQFAKDLEEHVPEPKAAPVVATPQEALPAVSVQVGGALQITDNLDLFGRALRQFVGNIPQQPETDVEFADCEEAVKTLKKAEDALKAAENNALAQISDVNTMRQTVATLHDLARTTRLATEKLVKAEKENRKRALLIGAQAEIDKYIDDLNAQLDKPWCQRVRPPFADVVKGLKSLDSMKDKLSVALAEAKGNAHEQAQAYQRNRDALKTDEQDWISLFADFQDVGAKPAEDFDALMQLRVTQHKQAEAERLEAERARIRAEEEAKAREAAERQVIAAERERMRIRMEEEAKARAEAALAAAQQQETKDVQPADMVADGRIVEPAAPTPAAQGSRQAQDATQQATPVAPKAAASNAPEEPEGFLTLGQINEALAPIAISGRGLRDLGFHPAQHKGAAKLYAAKDYWRICSTLIQHLHEVSIREFDMEEA